MTQKIVNGLRSIATEIEMVTDTMPGAMYIPVPVDQLNDWIGDIRVCADDLGDD